MTVCPFHCTIPGEKGGNSAQGGGARELYFNFNLCTNHFVSQSPPGGWGGPLKCDSLSRMERHCQYRLLPAAKIDTRKSTDQRNIGARVLTRSQPLEGRLHRQGTAHRRSWRPPQQSSCTGCPAGQSTGVVGAPGGWLCVPRSRRPGGTSAPPQGPADQPCEKPTGYVFAEGFERGLDLGSRMLRLGPSGSGHFPGALLGAVTSRCAGMAAKALSWN